MMGKIIILIKFILKIAKVYEFKINYIIQGENLFILPVKNKS